MFVDGEELGGGVQTGLGDSPELLEEDFVLFFAG